MASVSSISTISKVFSKLGDNSGSVIPMFAKDTVSNGLISYTYFKDSGKVEGVERTLEEFGTGAIWLGGIPFVKKFIFDNFIYKKAGINPDIDAKRLFSSKNSADSIDFALDIAKQNGSKFEEQAKILEKTIKNKGLAKKLSVGKFAISTAATALMMYGLITLKQKRTEKEIEKNVRKNMAQNAMLKKSLKENQLYQTFTGKEKTKEPRFGSLGTFFMTNPVANTLIVDSVITGTRLKQGRKGEKGEVGFKEACQLISIYGLATPLQKGLEFISKKCFGKSIALDYPVLDSVEIKNAITKEKAQINSSTLLNDAKEIYELLGKDKKIPEENIKKAMQTIFEKENSDMAQVLKKSGIINTFKTKDGCEQLSLLSGIDMKKVRNATKNTIDLIEKAAKNANPAKYMKQTKFLKGASILANIGISAFLIGYIQPKINLYFRKIKNGGDNTNPAIRTLTNEIEHKIAFQGQANSTGLAK